MATTSTRKSSNADINRLNLLLDTEKHKNIELQRQFDEFRKAKSDEIEALQCCIAVMKERMEKVTYAFEVVFAFLKGGAK